MNAKTRNRKIYTAIPPHATAVPLPRSVRYNERMNVLVDTIENSKILRQIVPLSLTIVVLLVLIFALHSALLFFNLFPVREVIDMHIHWVDVAIGITIYLKTSIDFAIFMGRLMATNTGWKNRVAIEIGTAAGNALGTIAIIGLWVLFKDVHILLALMVTLAALVLFELAHGSLEHFETWNRGQGTGKKLMYRTLAGFLGFMNTLTSPILTRIMPNLGEKLKGKSTLSWKDLLVFSASVPFILGLDDFAGYVPLFSVINVYGFAIGVIAAHTILNISLFISPTRTIKMVKNEYISFAGTVAFIGLAFYGLWESVRIIMEMFH